MKTWAQSKHRSLMNRGKSAKRKSTTSLVWIWERNCSFQNCILIPQRVNTSSFNINLLYIISYILNLIHIQSHLHITVCDHFLMLLLRGAQYWAASASPLLLCMSKFLLPHREYEYGKITVNNLEIITVIIALIFAAGIQIADPKSFKWLVRTQKPDGDEWQVLAEVEDTGLMLASGDEAKTWLILVENRQKFILIGP